jgi:hypothetical protein
MVPRNEVEREGELPISSPPPPLQNKNSPPSSELSLNFCPEPGVAALCSTSLRLFRRPARS